MRTKFFVLRFVPLLFLAQLLPVAASPPPHQRLLATYSAGARSGDYGADRLLSALEGQDGAAMQRQIGYYKVPCANPPSGPVRSHGLIGYPPRCYDDRAGTSVDAVLVARCGIGDFFRPQDIETVLPAIFEVTRDLYAVVRPTDGVFRGGEGALYSYPAGTFSAWTDGDDRIRLLVFGHCGHDARVILATTGSDGPLLLGPRERSGEGLGRTPTAALSGGVETYPRGARSGDAEADRVAALVAKGDHAGLKALIEYRRVPCGVVKVGEPSPPACRKSEQRGTLVDALRVQRDNGCKEQYWRADRVDELLDMFFNHRFFAHYDPRVGPRLYAMYRSTGARGWPDRGGVGLVFSWQWSGHEASTIGLNAAGRIISIATRHCGYDARLVLYQSEGPYVLGPRER